MFSISQPLAGYASRAQHCAKLWDGKARQKEGHEEWKTRVLKFRESTSGSDHRSGIMNGMCPGRFSPGCFAPLFG